MSIEGPTLVQLRHIVSSLGMALSDDRLAAFHTLMDATVASYRVVDAMPDDKPVTRYPRTPGYQPGPEENQHNAWYVKSTVKGAESGPLAGVLDYSEEPLVSIDLNHNPASSTIDGLETAVLEGKLVRVVSWYDNEWGFSNRMVDTAGAMGKLL